MVAGCLGQQAAAAVVYWRDWQCSLSPICGLTLYNIRHSIIVIWQGVIKQLASQLILLATCNHAHFWPHIGYKRCLVCLTVFTAPFIYLLSQIKQSCIIYMNDSYQFLKCTTEIVQLILVQWTFQLQDDSL